MKKILLPLIISLYLFNFNQIYSQVNFNWVNQIGDLNQVNGASHDIVDKTEIFNNSVYATGLFTGTVDFDPGPNALIYSTVGLNFAPYIVKYDMNGSLVWAKRIEYNLGSGSAITYDFAINSNEEIIIVGQFYGTIDADPGSAVHTLTTGPTLMYSGLFIIQLDKNGDFITAKSITNQNPTSNDMVANFLRVAVDANLNIIITSDYSGTYDFDFSNNSSVLSGGGYFMAKYDNSFNLLWVEHMDGISIDKLKVNANNEIFLSGLFTGTVDFDQSSSNFNLTALPNQTATYFCKYASNLNFISAFKFDGPIGFIKDFTLDNLNNIYITGDFLDSLDVDPSNGVSKIYAIKNYRDMFIAKYDAATNLIWVKEFEPIIKGVVVPSKISIDGSGNIYTTGGFSVNTDFDPSPVNSSNTPALYGYSNIFVNKLNSTGDFVFSEVFGPGGVPKSISLNNADDIIIGGSFKNISFFSPSSTIVSLNATSGSDA